MAISLTSVHLSAVTYHCRRIACPDRGSGRRQPGRASSASPHHGYHVDSFSRHGSCKLLCPCTIVFDRRSIEKSWCADTEVFTLPLFYSARLRLPKHGRLSTGGCDRQKVHTGTRLFARRSASKLHGDNSRWCCRLRRDAASWSVGGASIALLHAKQSDIVAFIGRNVHILCVCVCLGGDHCSLSSAGKYHLFISHRPASANRVLVPPQRSGSFRKRTDESGCRGCNKKRGVSAGTGLLDARCVISLHPSSLNTSCHSTHLCTPT